MARTSPSCCSEKGYEVHGLIRRSSSFSTGRIEHLYRDPHEEDVRLFLHYSDLSDASSLITTLNNVKPDEVYNLGAQSHVKVSFEMPEFTADATAMGNLRLLEAIRHVDHDDPLLPGRLERDVRAGRRNGRRPSGRRSTRAARTPWPRCSPTG